MIRETLDRQIHQIEDELLWMGSAVERATMGAIKALKAKDFNAARQIYSDDKYLNEKRFAIENAILILIATQQPMAHDLRLLAAMLEISSEMERMGDYAKGICKVIVQLDKDEISIPFDELELMADKAIKMLHDALNAFITEDTKTASSIPAMDDEVDLLFNKINKEIVHYMFEHPEKIDHANLLMWVIHNLERMADRVTNICERTIFVVTGELYEMESKKKEQINY
jgi:phosphate transport system protein